jgi:hypothetical protein
VTDSFNAIKPSTAGERLFQRIGTFALKDLSPNRLTQQKFVRLTGRGAKFGLYLEGSTVAFSFKRVMKATRGIFRDKNADSSVCNLRLAAILREWFDWLDKDSLAVLVRDALRAEDASDRPIPKSVETDIWHARRVHSCCFCGKVLTADANSVVKDAEGNKATLEHVWPASLGGDSIVENLVPACGDCNRQKKDLFTWEQGDIHDFIYPVDFHLSEFLLRVPIAQRILLQRRAVMILAQRDRLTLKQALVRVGAYGSIGALDSTDTWDIFNIQNHFDSVGELLW